MTAQDQQSREAFEQSAQEIWPEMNIVRGHYGGYLDFNTHDKWIMWQSARRTPAAIDVDALAQEIRRVDGSHTLGAGALAEAMLPFINANATKPAQMPEGLEPVTEVLSSRPGNDTSTIDKAYPDGTKLYTAAQVLAMGCVPPGWQAVPREPDAQMLATAKGYGLSERALRGIHAAFLAAAPRPPAAQEVQQDKRDAERWLVEAYEKGRGVPRYLR